MVDGIRRDLYMAYPHEDCDPLDISATIGQGSFQELEQMVCIGMCCSEKKNIFKLFRPDIKVGHILNTLI